MSMVPGVAGVSSLFPDGAVGTNSSSPIPLPQGATGGTALVPTPLLLTKGFASAEYVGTDPEVGGSTPFQLTSSHRRTQSVAGSGTIKMPTTGIKSGELWTIENRSTSDYIIQASDASEITRQVQGYVCYRALQDTPTASTHWAMVAGYEKRSAELVKTSLTLVTNGVASNITSVGLPRGNWLIRAQVGWEASAVAGNTNTSQRIGNISTTSATLSATPYDKATLVEGFTIAITTSDDFVVPLSESDYAVSATGLTTHYLVQRISFDTAGGRTMSAFGRILATRIFS